RHHGRRVGAGAAAMSSTPTVNRMADVVTIDFHEEMVYATLDRFRDLRGDVWVEATLRTSAPGVEPDLHQSRLNLCSMSHREQLVRILRRRFPVDAVNWPEVVERIARVGLEAYRTGQPVVLVGRLPRLPGPQYFLEPIVLAGQLNWLYGPGGTGKTTIAVAVALSVQERVPLLGLPLPPTPVRALHLDF